MNRRKLERLRCIEAGESLIYELKVGELSDERLNVLRETIQRQECPFCGKTAFRIVAQHIWKVHGITRDELSNLVGFTFSERICSIEASEKIKRILGPGYKGTRGDGPRKSTASVKFRQINEERARRQVKLWGSEWHRAGAIARNKLGAGVRTKPQQHGTLREYDKWGCRCDLCKKAKAENNAANRVRYRETVLRCAREHYQKNAERLREEARQRRRARKAEQSATV